MSDDVDPGRASRRTCLAEFAADPEAPRWARDCAWIPGTGHCRDRACSTACLFRPQREAEAVGVRQSRRRRRPAQTASVNRLTRHASLLLLSAPSLIALA